MVFFLLAKGSAPPPQTRTRSAPLQRALRFATQVVPFPVFFVLTDSTSLGSALDRHYPIPGLDSCSVGGELESFFTDLERELPYLAA